MTRTHVPVLAGELIDLTSPAPGETAVDCTFGAGGHARLVADRLGPAGTLVCIDRDPAAEERFDELATRGALRDALPSDGLRGGPGAAGRRGGPGGRRLPRPRHLLDAGRRARARLLLQLRRAARHAHGPVAGARRARDRERVGRAAPVTAAAPLRRGAPTPAASRARSSAAAAGRRSPRPASWPRPSRPPSRPRCAAASAADTRRSAASRPSASR